MKQLLLFLLLLVAAEAQTITPPAMQVDLIDTVATRFSKTNVNSPGLSPGLAVNLASRWVAQGKSSAIVVVPTSYLSVASQIRAIAITGLYPIYPDLVSEWTNIDGTRGIRLRRMVRDQLWAYITVLDSPKAYANWHVEPLWHLLTPVGNKSLIVNSRPLSLGKAPLPLMATFALTLP